jgi:hypothetical protein
MVQAKQMTARADQLITMAEKMRDPSLARSLRQRAMYWNAIALEIAVFESDPFYRRIHDGPAASFKTEPASLA